MADEIRVPDDPNEFNYSDLLDAGQIDNIIIGLTTAKSGVVQAYTELREALGFDPKGTTEFVTQEEKKDLDILRGASFDDQQLSGAGGYEFAGEAAPLFMVPFGGSVRAAAGLGGVASSTFFHDDPTNTSRLADIGLGAVTGGLFKGALNLLKQGGPARKAAEEAVQRSEMKLLPPPPQRVMKLLPPPPQKLFPPPPQRVEQKLLTDQSQKMLPPPRAKGVSPRASLKDQGFDAFDFQNAGKSPIPGFQGIPKPRVRDGFTRSQRALAKARKSPSINLAKGALRKAEVHAANAARKAKMLQKSLATAVAKKVKPHIINKLAKETSKATEDKVVKTIMRESIAQHIAKQEAGISTKPDLRPRTTVAAAETPVDTGTTIKPHIQGPEAASSPKTVGSLGNKQSGVINTDLQALVAGAGAGGTLGAIGFEGDPVGIAAGALGGAIGLRAAARRIGKAPVTQERRAKLRKASKDAGDLNEEISRLTKAGDITKESANNIYTKAKKVADAFLGSTMTRLEDLSPRVAVALKEAEFNQHSISGQWMAKGDELMARIENANLTDAQRKAYKIALLNNSANAKKYLNSIGKTDAANAVGEFETVLNKAAVYLESVGLGKGLRKNYFPRMVKDLSQFERIVEVQDYLSSLAKKKGVSLSNFEKEQAITDVINGALKHSNDDTTFGRASGNLQRRTNKVTAQNVDAYADPHEAFNDYVESITTQVERRKFFQGQGVKVDDLGPNAENIDSVANRLKDQLKGGDITPEELDEVAQLVRMRFGKGEQAPHRTIQNFKNLTYTGLLANPLAAATQFGDIALSAHRNGIRNTVAAVVNNLSGRGKIQGLDKEKLLGIRNAATDFASKTATRDVLNWGLKYSGFQAMDRLGKNTFIQSAMMKNQQLDKNAFFSKWRGTFDPDAAPGATAPRTEELFKKVSNFEEVTDANREDIGFMLWNELSDVQPISLSAMPEKYLKHPDGRMAYMLQSFTIKLFDVMRKDIIKQAQAGNRLQAAKNATRLSSLFVLTNSGVDAFKDFMLQRDSSLPDTVLNNSLKMFGVNKFMVGQAEREGLGSAALKAIAPPTALLDAVGDTKKAVGLLPIGGRFLQDRVPE